MFVFIYNKYIAKDPKTKFGNQTAIIGEKSDCWANTPKTLSKNTYVIATDIPKAKLIPAPPLLLTEETENAIRVNINIEKGILHFLCLTTWYLPILDDPLDFS